MTQNDIDTAAREMLGHLMRAKAFFKRCDVVTIENMIGAAQEVLEAKKKEEIDTAIRMQKINKGKDEIIDNIRDFCAKNDISFEEFMNADMMHTQAKQKAKDSRNLVKYRVEAFGRIYDWKGAGIMPVVIRAALVKLKCSKGAILLPEAEWYVVDGKLDFSVDSVHQAEVEKLAARYGTT